MSSEKYMPWTKFNQCSKELVLQFPLCLWRKLKFLWSSTACRGYYKCSTSKGCSAKKQVERCRTGAAVLIITYTSSHNHPCPTVQNINLTQQFKEPETQVQGTEDRPTTPKQEPREEKEETQNEFTVTMTTIDEDVSEDQFHYLQSPISCPQDIMINPEDRFTENIEKDKGTLNLLLDKEPLSSYPNLMTCSTPKSEENDFFDELEELPTSSVFNSFIRSNLFDERIPAVPSWSKCFFSVCSLSKFVIKMLIHGMPTTISFYFNFFFLVFLFVGSQHKKVATLRYETEVRG